MMYGIIYMAKNLINEKVYIGQTIKTLTIRKTNHYAKTSGCKFFSHALQKYNKEDWKWVIIDTAFNQEQLDLKEKFWIDFYNSTNPKKRI